MNKKLMAAAVAGALAIPGMAFAQSGATLYGTIDLGVKNQSKVNTATGNGSVTEVSSQNRTSNRWGLKGSEDLGGGLKANFDLEAGYASDTGDHATGSWDRMSWLGLSSGENSVELGYDYTTNFKITAKYDPMSYTYTGITPVVGMTGVRTKNMVQGQVGFNGVTLMAQYGMGEVPGSSSAGRNTGIGGYWSGNGLTIGLGTMQQDDGTGNAKNTLTTFGAAYAMNQFTFRAGLLTQKWDSGYVTSSTAASVGIVGGVPAVVPASVKTATFEKSRLAMIGVEYAFSDRVSGRVAYYDTKDSAYAGGTDGKKKLTMVAVDYSLSKSTTAYAELDHNAYSDADVSTKAGALADGATGIGVGIVHAF